MNIKYELDYKKYFTLEDIEITKIVKAYMKDDTETAAGYAEMAANEALKSRNDAVKEVIKAAAYFSKNCRVYNIFGNTNNMDIWIEFTVMTYNGFLIGGAYLSDIWQTGQKGYANHMYTRYFTEEH